MSQKIPTLQERAHVLGNVIGINAYNVHHASLRAGLIAQGYTLQETSHFLIARRDVIRQDMIEQGAMNHAPTVIAHRFAPSEIDANLGSFVMEELKPFDLLMDPQHFGDVFGAIVMSLAPRDPERAWRLYATNTLTRYHALINKSGIEPRTNLSMNVFASLYRRVCELHTGKSLLDAGCSFGFLPLVVAERIPTLTRVVGVDIETSPFATSQYIATKRHLTSVQFRQANLLSNDVAQLGQFDTVTILHVLEHFTEAQMYEVLTPLLRIAKQRLIIAVPYEEGKPEEAYGHRQLFTAAKLEHIGRWCIEKMGRGIFEVEECVGGLLMISR